MPTTDSRVDTYIAGKALFAQPILHHLRARVHAACPDTVETIKWGMPFFTLNGRPLANMAAFKEHASFGFWNRADLPREEGFAELQEGDGMGLYGKLRSIDDLPDDATLERQIAAAAELIAVSGRPKRPARTVKPEAEVPRALVDALAGDAAAKATFDGFPPSCRRDYCDWVAEAKRPETAAKRVAETIALLREGKRRNWRYEKN